MHKLRSGANCGPTVFNCSLRVLFVPFCMDLCKTVVGVAISFVSLEMGTVILSQVTIGNLSFIIE